MNEQDNMVNLETRNIITKIILYKQDVFNFFIFITF